LGFTAGAMAADLPRRAAPPIYAPIPVFTWTGFYVGVNAGYGWSSNNNNNDCFGCFGGVVTVDTTPGGATVAPLALPSGAIGFAGSNSGGSRDGFVGGAQIGANYQFTPGSGFVVGVEADIQWLGGDNDSKTAFFGDNLFRHPAVPPFGVPGAGIEAVPVSGSNVAIFNRGGFGGNNGNDWFGTARVRVGYAFDRVLVYGTGGFAFTDGGNKNNGFFGVTNGDQVRTAFPGFYVSPAAAVVGSTVGTGGFFGKNSSNDVGWVLGAGVEYAWTNNLTVKLEGLWVSMDSNNNNNGGFSNGIIGVSNTGAPIRSNAFFGGNNNNDNEFFVVRLGVNYKFGW